LPGEPVVVLGILGEQCVVSVAAKHLIAQNGRGSIAFAGS
jgi:hypothetical protein